MLDNKKRMVRENKKKNRRGDVSFFAVVLLGSLFIFFFLGLASAVPGGPDSVTVTANETKSVSSPYTLNTSGGYITTINITSTTQNPRWKAFVGQVSGTFTLDDSSGSTIYDWSMTTVAGEVYATRNSSSISWTNIKCANTSLLENENTLMSHTNPDDNITATFSDTTHSEFFVASVNISVNSCPTLNTYVGNSSQDTNFEEVVLSDSTNFSAGGNLIYATILEQDATGFDNSTYDFQMIVPENGAEGFSGATAYYLYVELS